MSGSNGSQWCVPTSDNFSSCSRSGGTWRCSSCQRPRSEVANGPPLTASGAALTNAALLLMRSSQATAVSSDARRISTCPCRKSAIASNGSALPVVETVAALGIPSAPAATSQRSSSWRSKRVRVVATARTSGNGRSSDPKEGSSRTEEKSGLSGRRPWVGAAGVGRLLFRGDPTDTTTSSPPSRLSRWRGEAGKPLVSPLAGKRGVPGSEGFVVLVGSRQRAARK
mmetsp:Transcript_27446/g.48918  ORF Transcript_27446/g.48918 Transcript_27446/m.48918 type:complete len:226 (+) Transcript_27446:771-1448(+)